MGARFQLPRGGGLGEIERLRQHDQLVGWHGPLDQREELALLQADMCGQPLSELVQVRWLRPGLAGETGGALADRDMIAEGPQDDGMMGVSVGGVGG